MTVLYGLFNEFAACYLAAFSHLIWPTFELFYRQRLRNFWEIGQRACGHFEAYRSTGTSSGNCQEMETCVVHACHMPWQPLQNHPSDHLGEWGMPWSAEKMQAGQNQRRDIPAHARTAHKGLMQKRLEEDLYWIICHVPPMTQSVKGLKWSM